MKKALKRLNGKTIRSVTEKRAVTEDDGEIVPRRIALRNRGGNDGTNSSENESKMNCMILLKRSRRKVDQETSSQCSKQDVESSMDEMSFAPGEQIIKDKVNIEGNQKGKRSAKEDESEENAAKPNKSKSFSKRLAIDKTVASKSANKTIAASILEPFIKSPEGVGTNSKPEQKLENRHRLSLSRKKFVNRDNMQSHSSSEQQSVESDESSENKENLSTKASKMHTTSLGSSVAEAERDTSEERNIQPEVSVPKTPRCAIRLRRVQATKGSEVIAETTAHSDKEEDISENNTHPEATVPQTSRCLIRMRRIQAQQSSEIPISSDLGKDSSVSKENVRQPQIIVSKISGRLTRRILNSTENIEKTSIVSGEEKNIREQKPSEPQTPRCLVKVRRIHSPLTSKDQSKATKRKLLTEKQNMKIPAPKFLKTNQMANTQLENNRTECKSPEIFSDPDPANESDIYAFHTQSSQSEHEDVAADIIQKLKQEGKIKMIKPKLQQNRKLGRPAGVRPENWCSIRKNVTVAESTTKKQRGRPKKNSTIAGTSPNKNAAHTKKFNIPKTSRKGKVGRPKKNYSLEVENQTVPAFAAGNNDYDDHFDQPENIQDEHEPEPAIDVVKSSNRKSDGFSSLAKKVLREQTAIMSPMKSTNSSQNKNFDKIQLLEMAKKLVSRTNLSHSTPNKPNSSLLPVERRPMAQFPSGGASPWRVDNENIPRLFYFSRTSDNLPSYSSDVIPSSQPSNESAKQKESSKNSTAVSPSRILSDSLNISAIQDISPIKSHSNNASNLSNIENISPVKPIGQKIKDTGIIFNANPRRGLADRSPLKPINILNVVTLPNRVPINQASGNVKPNKKNKENITMKPNRLQNHNKSINNNTLKDASIASDFFGFSDSENIDDDEVLQSVPKSKLPSKKRLHHTLKKLKRLLPPKPTRVSHGTIRSIFNSPKKQKDIREMLSSTRANAEPAKNVAETSIRVEDESSNDEMSSIDHNEENSTIADADLHLFDDLTQPQSSFNASLKIRTYERPKRKAKRIRSFILFHSDSENEDDAPVTKSKRSKPDKNKKEFKKFVNEFNSMCDEVDQYELVVEKDKSG